MNPEMSAPLHETALNLLAEGLICVPGEECGVDLTSEGELSNVVLGYN